MISRIKKNFAELMESLTIKKDEILKQNKIINLESLLSFYEENKKIFLEKKEVLLTTINEYIPSINLKIDVDLSFIEKLDITCINELIEKVGKFYEDNCIEPVENDIREKVVEKFKKIIKFSKILYINFIDTISNYSLNYFSKKTERAPPIKFLFD
ncbi:hypothetical protein LDK18_05570 [Fusobacterium nucleatum subsp. nucleatum ATCC 23726]|uniref:Uncharacterized protein n=2 Tax=Fusobacterium nucleatum subsp. nucleatum TaxID=76856 RepID=A0A0M4RTC9_FUSNC|nr:hypothetical protein [Fusobacterium nucleatum]ALF24077.1 hypothetical protein RO05_06740 [Fusobacterium nucleatum subsp. nucleatum ChDC F316]ALF25136.1 hypothetical protein RN95_01330 [Fusobacterium nucleatum subsp. nucleatum]EFG96164.1 hypothetical protein HMPREF0397_0306 [Fusobacterium nucleatum subsp. nucleatum ATCC 23726]ERT42888.1 hypothetical protein HMPREF1539_01243 [Fusobacterium nucleatum CTI-2]KUL98454.1 hypothetical protein RO03_02680 [Fusobacterium nucleatum subsp. nucleatum]